MNHSNELNQICDCILEGCMQDDLRVDAIHMKAKLLHAAGDTDGTLELLSRLPAWYAPIAKEQLFGIDTAEFRYWNRKICYGLIDVMSIKLARIIRFDPSISITDKSERWSKWRQHLIRWATVSILHLSVSERQPYMEFWPVCSRRKMRLSII